MQKNTNRLLSKIVLSCLIINTLPLHLPINGSALPKGQELVRLKQEINRDISSIKKTTSTLKNLRITIPRVLVGAGVVAALAAFAAGVIFFLALKKILSGRFEATKRKIEDKVDRIKEKFEKDKDAIKATENVIKKEKRSFKKRFLIRLNSTMKRCIRLLLQWRKKGRRSVLGMLRYKTLLVTLRN